MNINKNKKFIEENILSTTTTIYSIMHNRSALNLHDCSPFHCFGIAFGHKRKKGSKLPDVIFSFVCIALLSFCIVSRGVFVRACPGQNANCDFQHNEVVCMYKISFINTQLPSHAISIYKHIHICKYRYMCVCLCLWVLVFLRVLRCCNNAF